MRPWRNGEQCGSIWYVNIYVTYIHIYSHTNKPRFLAEQVLCIAPVFMEEGLVPVSVKVGAYGNEKVRGEWLGSPLDSV